MIGMEVDYPLGATILKKKFSKMNPGQIAAKKKRNKFGSNIMFQKVEFDHPGELSPE